ncbi:hypothetical protein M3Y99_01995000 [Aphelenchoides fujianensis]|nr:hypothetical protein M3Y99_01995000 [Aphelenchoides fujianensis]
MFTKSTLFLFSALIVAHLAVSYPISNDEMSIVQVQSDTAGNDEQRLPVEDLQVAPSVRPSRKPKIADQKTKVMPPVQMDREFDEMLESPTELPLSGDLFKDLMTPLENENSEMESSYKMKISKFDENPRVDGPK